MIKDKMKLPVTRSEAADRPTRLAGQLREGSVALNGPMLRVPEKVDMKAELEKDKLEVEIKWHESDLAKT